MPRSASSCFLLSWPSRLLVTLCRAAPWGAALAALLCSVLPLCTSAVFRGESLIRGVIGRAAGGARLQRGAQRVGNRELGQRAGIHEDVDGFDRDDHAVVARDSDVGADRERRGAKTRRRDRQLEHLVVARRRLPLDCL